MKKTGAWIIRYALEQIGVEYTFGIPGVHNTELYDELNNSKSIEPILVTHETAGSFMADAISRTSDTIGTMVIVPAAGAAYVSAGLGEAYLAGIPMLVICGGIRRDTDMSYQLHDVDQSRMLSEVTKKFYLVASHEEILPTIYQAFEVANEGEPGPVFVEVPVNLQLFTGEAGSLDTFESFQARQPRSNLVTDTDVIEKAADMLLAAKNPGLFLGWGAVDASEYSISLAQMLNAPVATTLQGLSAFPANHPLHTGMSFGKAAVPAAENAFKNCDCMLAVGARFGEIATGSFGVKVPRHLIHVDINPDVFNKNYPAECTIAGDARVVLEKITTRIREKQQLAQIEGQGVKKQDNNTLQSKIARDKRNYLKEWYQHDSGQRVNPARFFSALRGQLDDDAIVVADDGNHTFLVAELMPIIKPRSYISPTDFNCMGYCVPAVIGAGLVNPGKQVVGIIGDGAFAMTCMEIMTATRLKLGGVYFVFNDGELSQISQAQEIPYNRKTCSILGQINVRGVAEATGAEFITLQEDKMIEPVITQALQLASNNRPVIVDVNIDYSKRTRFTKGIVKTNLKRFPLKTKVRFIGRAISRKIEAS